MVERLDLVAARLRRVQVEDLDFREIIKRYDRPWTLFFCDPPYYGAKRYKYNFSDRDHEDLAELLRAIKGKFLLTYNDHPRVRHLYAGFDLVVEKLPVYGSLVKGERSRRLWDQLIIANYPLHPQPRRLQQTLFREGPRIPGAGPAFKSQGPKVRTS